ncbi:MAG: hypothetical protein CV089_22465 [Nitrospira sp. WS110]|nr:hypothetical protein [Nitrospira sp. WS110]
MPPAQRTDLHRSCPARGELTRILCIKTKRVLRRDWTVAHNGHIYQVHTNVRATQVVLEERLDGTLRMTHPWRKPMWPPRAILAAAVST